MMANANGVQPDLIQICRDRDPRIGEVIRSNNVSKVSITTIMEMPDLVMDKIFSFLPLKDRLNCRLVTPRWGPLDLLPIRRVFKGCILRIGCKSDPPYNDVYDKGDVIPLNFDMQPMNIQPIIDSSFFDSVGVLSISEIEEVEAVVPICLEHCRNATRLIFHGFTQRNVQGIITFVQNNQSHLKGMGIRLRVDPGDSFSLKSLLTTCPVLQFLQLDFPCQNGNPIEDLGDLPSSLIYLFMLNPLLTRTQISSAMCSDLPNLRWVELYVKHSHGQYYDPDELDLPTILDLLPTLPSLRYLSFFFFLNEREVNRRPVQDQPCGKARELGSSLRDNLDGRHWNITVGMKPVYADFRRENLTIIRKRMSVGIQGARGT